MPSPEKPLTLVEVTPESPSRCPGASGSCVGEAGEGVVPNPRGFWDASLLGMAPSKPLGIGRRCPVQHRSPARALAGAPGTAAPPCVGVRPALAMTELPAPEGEVLRGDFFPEVFCEDVSWSLAHGTAARSCVSAEPGSLHRVVPGSALPGSQAGFRSEVLLARGPGEMHSRFPLAKDLTCLITNAEREKVSVSIAKSIPLWWSKNGDFSIANGVIATVLKLKYLLLKSGGGLCVFPFL